MFSKAAQAILTLESVEKPWTRKRELLCSPRLGQPCRMSQPTLAHFPRERKTSGEGHWRGEGNETYVQREELEGGVIRLSYW